MMVIDYLRLHSINISPGLILKSKEEIDLTSGTIIDRELELMETPKAKSPYFVTKEVLDHTQLPYPKVIPMDIATLLYYLIEYDNIANLKEKNIHFDLSPAQSEKDKIGKPLLIGLSLLEEAQNPRKVLEDLLEEMVPYKADTDTYISTLTFYTQGPFTWDYQSLDIEKTQAAVLDPVVFTSRIQIVKNKKKKRSLEIIPQAWLVEIISKQTDIYNTTTEYSPIHKVLDTINAPIEKYVAALYADTILSRLPFKLHITGIVYLLIYAPTMLKALLKLIPEESLILIPNGAKKLIDLLDILEHIKE